MSKFIIQKAFIEKMWKLLEDRIVVWQEAGMSDNQIEEMIEKEMQKLIDLTEKARMDDGLQE